MTMIMCRGSTACLVVLLLSGSCWYTNASETTIAFGFPTPFVASSFSSSSSAATSTISVKDSFVSSLDSLATLNDGTKERTRLLNDLVDNKQEIGIQELMQSSSLWNQLLKTAKGGNDNDNDMNASPSATKPGSLESMLPVAPGQWKVVYAPHMTTIRDLVRGNSVDSGMASLDVRYDMRPDQTITSHATFRDFPWMKPFGVRTVFLSVSGRYGSVDDDRVCFVEWDKTWVRVVANDDYDIDEPYATLEDVPTSMEKNVINAIGKVLFIRPFSVFPVSFLDQDLTVFDFELLGTRICARKQ